MKIYERVLLTDGGTNDKGTVVEYKAIEVGEKPPKPKHGFEEWREISLKTYLMRKEQAYVQYKLFTF